MGVEDRGREGFKSTSARCRGQFLSSRSYSHHRLLRKPHTGTLLLCTKSEQPNRHQNTPQVCLGTGARCSPFAAWVKPDRKCSAPGLVPMCLKQSFPRKKVSRTSPDCNRKLSYSSFPANQGRCQGSVDQQSTTCSMTTPVLNRNKKSQDHKYIHPDKDRKVNVPNVITPLLQADKHVAYTTGRKQFAPALLLPFCTYII